MNNNRNLFIDLIKAVAIFLMLWGHCIQYCIVGSGLDFFENSVFKFIYSFHMPLFMLVSGYLFFFSFSKRSFKDLLVQRTQSLLQPIVFCSLFSYLVTTALFRIVTGRIIAVFDGTWIRDLSSLWFLWSVLASSVVTSVVCKKVKLLSVQIVLLCALFPIVALFPNTDYNIYMYPYFVFGFYFAQYKDKIRPIWLKMKYLSWPLFPIMLCFYEKKHYIYTTGIFSVNGRYSFSQMLLINAYRWLIGFIGSLFVISILQIIYQIVIEKFKGYSIISAVSVLGRKSLQIYTLSVPLLSIYLSTFFSKALSLLNIDNVFVKNIFVYNYVFTFSLALAYAFGLYFFVKILEKIKLARILFGK